MCKVELKLEATLMAGELTLDLIRKREEILSALKTSSFSVNHLGNSYVIKNFLNLVSCDYLKELYIQCDDTLSKNSRGNEKRRLDHQSLFGRRPDTRERRKLSLYKKRCKNR